MYNANTSQILGVQIIGMHAADLIQECANAMAAGTTCKELAMMVSYDLVLLLLSMICRYLQTHTHPTLSEVIDAAFKGAAGMSSH